MVVRLSWSLPWGVVDAWVRTRDRPAAIDAGPRAAAFESCCLGCSLSGSDAGRGCRARSPLVRVMVPVVNSQAEAQKAAVEMAAQAAAELPAFVPN